MRAVQLFMTMLGLFVIMTGCRGDKGNVIEASGTIEGTDVNIGTEVAGRVRTLRVDEGARVTAGDTLVIIDDADYQIQLRQALANLEASEAQLRLAEEGWRKEEIVQAEANFSTAEADYKRMKDLLASQSITQKQYDEAYMRYVNAQQTFEKLSRGLRKDEVLTFRARRDQAAAQTDQLRKKVRDCSLLAPTSGTITLKAVEPGEFVMVGANLLRLTYLDIVKLTIYVSETELGNVRLGQKATVTIDTEVGTSFEGTVVYISPVAEFTPKNVQTKEERSKLVFGVKIEVPNPHGVLKPGMPADARLSAAS
jgi:HlyD family secretion protein